MIFLWGHRIFYWADVCFLFLEEENYRSRVFFRVLGLIWEGSPACLPSGAPFFFSDFALPFVTQRAPTAKAVGHTITAKIYKL